MPLYFVHPHVIARLESGQFVAKRQQNKAYRLKDRRNMLSPLNVTRRAIRYQPLVFLNRKEMILKAVDALNSPDVRLMMISGPSGRGKTALTRGVLEMMGSGAEQVLWFDVSRHTDYDEVVRFLVEYMTLVCRSASQGPPLPDTTNPIVTLERLLRMVRDIPILVVIDNMEYLVAPDKTLRSKELKEAFHFLLGFANVKMLFVGKNLPTADMNPDSAAVSAFAVDPLPSDLAENTLHELAPTVEAELQQALVQAAGGEPSQLALFGALLAFHPQKTDWLTRLASGIETPQVLLDVLTAHLSSEERLGLEVFAMVRHGVTAPAFETIVETCEPMLTGRNLLGKDHGRMHLALKKVYPPQLVLQHLQHQDQYEGESIRPYYQVSELLQARLVQSIAEDTQARYHEALQGFYVAEKAKHVLARVYPARTRHLAAEAQYHGSRVRRRRMAALTQGGPTPMAYPDFNPPARREPLPMAGDLPWPTFHEAEAKPVVEPKTWPAIEPHGRDVFPNEPSVALPRRESLRQEGFALEGPTPTVHLSEDDLIRLAELIAMGTPQPLESPGGEPSIEAHAEIAPVPDTVSSPFHTELVSDDEWPLREALEQAILTHSRSQIAQSLMALGQFRMAQGRSSNGEACLQKALDYAKDVGDTAIQVACHLALGDSSQLHFRHNQALSHYQDVVRHCEAHPSQFEDSTLAQALLGLAQIYAFRQEGEKSLGLLHKALHLPKISGLTRAQCLQAWALRLDEEARLPEAVDAYQQAAEAYKSIGETSREGQCYLDAGALWLELDKLPEANHCLTRATALLDFEETLPQAIEAYLLWADVALAQKDRDAAHARTESALVCAQRLGHPGHQANVLMQLGHLALQAHLPQHALDYFHQALDAGGETLSDKSRRRILTQITQLKETL